MDACQKHLMLPWMKAFGGRGRDRDRSRSCATFFLNADVVGFWERDCFRVPAWEERLMRPAEGRRGSDRDVQTDKLTLFFCEISSHFPSNTHKHPELRVRLRP
ncbi:hypothetical protein GOODEAATRI_014816 [Goodea atripinnis]|uniref:Uncharacterized protein n=1 Tax=Goodea atripinnis TaxID=208336 RepID=A0ABV0NMU6_9TELE